MSEINEQLKQISYNATKETTKQQQAVTTEGGVSEYQGTSEGQQKSGKEKGDNGKPRSMKQIVAIALSQAKYKKK